MNHRHASPTERSSTSAAVSATRYRPLSAIVAKAAANDGIRPSRRAAVGTAGSARQVSPCDSAWRRAFLSSSRMAEEFSATASAMASASPSSTFRRSRSRSSPEGALRMEHHSGSIGWNWSSSRATASGMRTGPKSCGNSHSNPDLISVVSAVVSLTAVTNSAQAPHRRSATSGESHPGRSPRHAHRKASAASARSSPPSARALTIQARHQPGRVSAVLAATSRPPCQTPTPVGCNRLGPLGHLELAKPWPLIRPFAFRFKPVLPFADNP